MNFCKIARWNHLTFYLGLLLSALELTDARIDVTLVVPTPIAAYNEEVFLKCVADDTLFKASQFPFRVEADIGTGTSMTYDRRYGRITPEPWPGRQVHLIEKAGPYKYGIFSCFVNDTTTGTTAKATSVVMSKNALLFPTTMCERASLNEFITLKALQLRSKPIDDIYWFHLGENQPPQRVGENQLQLNVSVNSTSAGTYLFFHKVRQNVMRIFQQGLMRLVVRNCPAKKYGNDCSLHCPSCENDGVCDDATGTCICPPGFMGDLCEIACGHNTFGAQCQHNCTIDDLPDGCKGKMFCLPDPFGCTCATGYSGLICTIGCAKGKYGAGCNRDCNCEADECDPYTGNCTTNCRAGWMSSNCQQPCNNGTSGLNCSETCGKCQDDAVCDPVTGHCPPSGASSSGNDTAATTVCQLGYSPPLCKEPCSAGWWGPDCVEECHCRDNEPCDVIEGTCPTVQGERPCDPGWREAACNEPCRAGTFGENCSSSCGHCYNGSACDPISSNCTLHEGACDAGYQPNLCTELCEPGNFGVNCSRLCNCANGTSCDAITGYCDGYCQPGWIGEDCWERCPDGLYGLNCSQECGNCQPVNGVITCDSSLGTCPDGCHRSWSGKYCDIGLLCGQEPCLHEGTCEQSEDIYRCICRDGFSGAHCEIIEPACDSGPCLNNALCVGNDVNATLFTCHCRANYTGKFCEVPPPKDSALDSVEDEQKDSFPWWLKTVVPAVVGVCLLGALAALLWYKRSSHKNKKVQVTSAKTRETSSSRDVIADPPDGISTSEKSLPPSPELPEMQEDPEQGKERNDEMQDEEPLPETPPSTASKPAHGKEAEAFPHRTSGQITFSDKNPPIKKESIAHVTPVHKVEAEKLSEDEFDVAMDSDLIKGDSNNYCAALDISSPFTPDSNKPLSYPPEPPNAPTDEASDKRVTLTRTSGETQVHRPSTRMRLNSAALKRLSDVSLHNFFNAPRKSSVHPSMDPISETKRCSTPLNRFSVGGCALSHWDPNYRPRDDDNTSIYGVSRRDSALLVTNARDVDEEFEMESRRGSVARFACNNSTS